MTGIEFVQRTLSIKKYKTLYDNNSFFRKQMMFIQKKREVHTQALLDSIAYTCELLFENELEKIELADQRMLMEESI